MTKAGWYQLRSLKKAGPSKAPVPATPPTLRKPRQQHVPAPPSSDAPLRKKVFDKETATLRGYDRHFDKATSMMEDLLQKQLNIAKLREYIQIPAVQEVLMKPAELRDAQLEIDVLAAHIRHEISQATAKVSEKAWENLESLGYKRPAYAMPQVQPPVQKSPSTDPPVTTSRKPTKHVHDGKNMKLGNGPGNATTESAMPKATVTVKKADPDAHDAKRTKLENGAVATKTEPGMPLAKTSARESPSAGPPLAVSSKPVTVVREARIKLIKETHIKKGLKRRADVK